MMSSTDINLKTWESVLNNSVAFRNTSISPSHVVVEFNRTKLQKIASHRLGRIEFESRVSEINSIRERVIAEELNSGRFTSISNVYSPQTSIESNPSSGLSYNVLSHGVPIAEEAGFENCKSVGLRCNNDSESDVKCTKGKCVIGQVSKELGTGKKWKYVSENKFRAKSGDMHSYSYYVLENEENYLQLHSLQRGSIVSWGPEDSSVTLLVDRPASVACRIYVPPKMHGEDLEFINDILVQIDYRLQDVCDPPKNYLTAVDNIKDLFTRKALELIVSLNRSSELVVDFSQPVSEDVLSQIITIVEPLPTIWKEKSIEELTNLYEQMLGSSVKDFISEAYNTLFQLYQSVIQVVPSTLKQSTLDWQQSLNSRPIYSRLPGIAEAYLKGDPQEQSPAQWLTSGADEFLSAKKEQIAQFYHNYLDPLTCNSLQLDWLAQHLGLFGELWDSAWPKEMKRSIILNAFKSTPLEFFDTQLETAVYSDIKFDEIEKIYISPQGEIDYYEKYFYLDRETIEAKPIDSIEFDWGSWEGLIPSKGSLISVMFLINVFGLKGHAPTELEILDPIKKLIRPRSGLRSSELDAQPLLPYKSNCLQVGDENDFEFGNYSNQLVAGFSRYYDMPGSKNIFFRVPFYYNRDGQSWSKANYIAKTWLPNNLNGRVQYAYLAADLWAVGDAFFEPELILNQ